MIRSVLTYLRFLTLGLCLMFMACSPRALHEAQRVVTEADSLRETGQIYDDSAALAQSYTTLGRWQWIHADQYAHACYHYGRILRRSDDPVAAMQVFIDATHSHTTDNHILGRVYSNMATFCRQADAFDISRDMYHQSEECFLSAGDSVAYFYALNNIAFTYATQGDSQKSDSILSIIDRFCGDSAVLTKTLETKAEAFLKTQQFDSAICYASNFYESTHATTGILIKAEAFSYLGIKDSSLHYAQMVMELSTYCGDHYNALYILSHDDSTLLNEDVLRLTSDREDVRNLNFEPWKEQLMLAVQLLEQDLNRKPDLRWLYAIVGTLLLVVTGLGFYTSKKRKQHKLLSQKTDDFKNEAAIFQIKRNELEKQFKNRQQAIEQDVLRKCALLRENNNFNTFLAWSDYNKMCQLVDNELNLLATKLQILNVLNETEFRLCILVLIGLGRADISKTLPYSLNSIGKLKDQTAKKLGTSGKELQNFLVKMTVKNG